ncbi:MAG: hypothetical protein JW892_07480 [Anaerolineae bacterium]|nr:hypothetical protein [Anaerolineae bacterium]
MATTTFQIKSEGKYKYITDGRGNKLYWLENDYLHSVDGKDRKIGYLKYYHDKDGNWYEVIVSGRTIGYVQK